MGKHEVIDDTPVPAGEGQIDPVAVGMKEAVVTPRMALANLDVSGETTKTAPMPLMEAPAREPAKIEVASIDDPQVADVDVAEPPGLQQESSDARPCAEPAAAASAGSASPRVNRFTLLAVSLAFAAALGGMAGALAAYALVAGATPAPVAVTSGIEEIQALKENVVQARVELAALKVALDAGNRSANAQFTRIGERIDRIDRTQTEPLTKLNKAIETLERFARGDITGATAREPTAGASKATVLEGWLVRDVDRGTALIEGRTGMFEVDAGDTVPGLGRVESIRKQDGRWVVVTSKGTIVSAR
jgi:hypothetical protein